MKKFALILGLSASLFSCSLLQRHEEDGDTAEVRDLEPQDGPLFDAQGNEVGTESGEKAAAAEPAQVPRERQASRGSRVDSQVAQLNTKIAALETKVDVLTASLERVQAERAQPVIHADTSPQPTMAAPVELSAEAPVQIEEPAQTHISAAPARPAPVPVKIKAPAERNSAAASGAEKEFRGAMQLFQNGQNLEAASRFALVAKKYPNHLLAGHALYWAGEAAARGQQMGLAGDNWAELEKRYPRSAYLPEALAGLAKAHEAQGDTAKAAHYRSLLLKSFPKSPVALRMDSTPATGAVARAGRSQAQAESRTHAPSNEEEAPLFDGSEEATEPPTESQ